MNNRVNFPGSYDRLATLAYGRFGQVKTEQIQATKPVQNFSSPTLEYIDPSKNGAISQLINDNYVSELRKDTKKILTGRKLEAFLKKTFSVQELEQLPLPAQNLIRFHRGMTAAEIIRFSEFWDNSHEIVFKDYSLEHAKFRALFEKLGKLYEVEMEAGHNNYVPLSKGFDIRKRIENIFSKTIGKLIVAKKAKKRQSKKRNRKYTKIELDDDNRS